MKSIFYAVVAIAVLAIAGFVSTQQVGALSGKDFNPGYIIDDTVFYNENALDTNGIQAFLNSKMPNCDTNGSRPASEFGRPDITRAQYAAQAGWQSPPFVCLRDYKQDTPNMEAASGLCNAISGGSQQSAAQIINNVAKACHISPHVLLVLLQKEQSLVTDSWPLNSQYKNATGFACPDTAPCNPAYNGFFYQVYHAARQFQVYKAYPNSYNYVAGRVNNIYYNPDLSRCGSSPVYIQNQATAALYIYTPYQPNASALNNLYGTGDSCGAYGNRNFWRLFSEWFGSTTAKFSPLDTPRWMSINNTQRKTNPSLDQQVSTTNIMNQGSHALFVDKIYLNDKWYLRTSFDSQNGNYLGVPLSEVSDLQFENFEQPRFMTLRSAQKKINPITGRTVNSETYSKSTYLRFTDKIVVNGEWFYRTEHDKTNGLSSAFKASELQDITFDPLETPRYMQVKAGTNALNLRNNSTASTYSSTSDQIIKDKILINNAWYFRTQENSATNNPVAIPATSVSDIEMHKIATPYTIKVKSNTTKFSLHTTEPTPMYTVAQNQLVKVTGIVRINNNDYYQSEFDGNNNNPTGIHVTDTDVNTVPFINLDTTRAITLRTNTQKINLLTGQAVGMELTGGTSIVFSTKVEIKGKWYLRTEFDARANSPYAIPIDQLHLAP